MDLRLVSGLLRKLSPRQEKVLRLYFGLGCERPPSAQEMAQELGVSAHAIGGILGAAQRRLAGEGLTTRDLREAARQEAEIGYESGHVLESLSSFRQGSHSHRRS